MLYVTYNDQPSGIYFSQVIDVCEFINSRLKVKVKLLAIISIRNYFSNRRKIRDSYPDSIILPMFPKVKNWRRNGSLVRLANFFLKEDKVIARGPFAANMCIDLKKKGIFKKVCFDARGAYTAEFTEYRVANDRAVETEIREIERRAIMESDQRLAVSNKLVEYWKNDFGFTDSSCVVIPCTLNAHHAFEKADENKRLQTRKELGVTDEEILVCYSGSSAAWQSFELLDELLSEMLKVNDKIKILFLSPAFPPEFKKIQKYTDRIIHLWIDPKKVFEKLAACDYGILYRQDSVTNRVASPVKFAEYLAAGMKVMISERIGDYSEFVKKNDCGIVLGRTDLQISFVPATSEERKRMRGISMEHFSKENYLEQYKKIVS